MALINFTPSSASWSDVTSDGWIAAVTSSVGNDTLDLNVTRGQNVTEGLSAFDSSAAGASIVSPIVMFLTGLIGNILALVVLHKTKSEIRSMMFYTLVAALTWNDLLGICLTSPPVLASYLNARHMPALPTLCTLHALAMVCFGLSTPFIVCAMAVERSLALKCCYFYSKHCTPNCARITVAALWAFVLFFGALPLVGVGSYTLQYPGTWCFLHFRSYIPVDMAYAGAYAVLNLLVIGVTVFCNGLVMTTLCRVRKSRKKSRSHHASSGSSGGDGGALLKGGASVDQKMMCSQQQQQQQQHVRRPHHRDVELQMILLLFAITTIFSVCWAPLMAYILYCLQSPDNSSPVFGLVAVRLASLNQTINPWIYVILRKSLLSRIRQLCRHYRVLCPRRRDFFTSQTSQHRRPTGFHNPPIYLQLQGAANNSNSSLKNKYVHVGNQLCPSSQFVGSGFQEPVSKGSVVLSGKKKKKKKSGEGSGGGSGGLQASAEVSMSKVWPEFSGDEGCSSACHDMVRGEEEGGRGDGESSSLQYSARTSYGHVVSQESNALRNEEALRPPPSPSLPAEGAYVDFFRHLPRTGRSAGGVVDDVHADPFSEPACKSETLPGKVVSEADDHGYSSRISMDSSPASTPERPPPDRSGLYCDLASQHQETGTTPCSVDARNALPASSRRSGHSKIRVHVDSELTAFTSPTKALSFLNEDAEIQSNTDALGARGVFLVETESSIHGDSSYIKHNLSSWSGTGARSEDIEDPVLSDGVSRDRPHHTRNKHRNPNAGFKDNSTDLTSGVFDTCDNDTNDDDDDGDSGDDRDDVYDDSVDPGQGRRGKEGQEEEMEKRRRESCSRTLSSSSSGTVVDSGSSRGYSRQWSSTSAQSATGS